MIGLFLSGARHLREVVGLEDAGVVVRRFPDGETYVRLENPDKVENETVILLQTPYPDQNERLVELFLALGAVRERNPARIVCVLPYFAYARQDREFVKGEAVSYRSIIRMLSCLGVSEIVGVDIHFMRREKQAVIENVRVTNLSGAWLLYEKAKQEHGNLVVVSPDLGGSGWLDSLGIPYEKGFSKKKVCPSCGKPAQECTCGTTQKEYVVSVEYSGDSLEGSTVLVLDDMIAGGGTMAGAARALRSLGAGRIVCAATHGLFVGSSTSLLEDLADQVLVTDTIDPSMVSLPGNARVESVRPVLREHLDNLGNL